MSIEIIVPELGESVLEATVAQWFKEEGERVKVGEVLVELETDKVNLEVGAERNGVLANIERQEGEDVAVGDVLGILEESEVEEEEEEEMTAEEGEGQAEAEPEAEVLEEEAQVQEQEPKATPVARQVAEEYQVALTEVQGTGPGGRIRRQDVEAYLEEARQAEDTEREPSKEAREKPAAEKPAREPLEVRSAGERNERREERVRMSRRRRTIARRLVEAQQTAAMLTTFNEVDMETVMALRRRRNPAIQERYGIKLGITSFFIKAAIGALKGFPRLNAEIDGDEMVLKHYYDIGVAIGAEEGLIVPVIRDADRLSLVDIDRQINEYAHKANEGSLSLEDLQGGTFTITNGGVFGSLLSTPILNPPQVGILGLHKIEARPVAVEGELEIHAMMYVAVSYDHRIVDGREAVQFLARIKELVEDPEKILLEG